MSKHSICSDGIIDLVSKEIDWKKYRFPGEIREVHYYEIQKSGTSKHYGHCYLLVNDEKPSYMGNIGFFIREEYRGNEYAVMAGALLFQIAETMGINTLFLAVNQDNKASKRVCEKLGCSYLETTRWDESGSPCSESSPERELYMRKLK